MSAPLSIAPQPHIAAALRRASRVTGTDFRYLLDTARRESAFKSEAKSSASSATGLFQFIEETWLATMKKAGALFGLERLADAIERTPDGRHVVPDADLRSEILALRKDPETAALMAGVYARESAEQLAQKIGRSPRSGELYLAHFLGPNGAVRLIEKAGQMPQTDAARLFPAAARANRSIFYKADGRARSVAEVYRNLTAQHGGTKLSFDAAAKERGPSGPRVVDAQVAADRTPLLQRLFIAPFEGDRLLRQAGPQRLAAMPPSVLDLFARSGRRGEEQSERSERVETGQVKRVRTRPAFGLLAAHAVGSDSPLTHSLFRSRNTDGPA